MLDTVFCGALRFVLGELAEIVVKSVGRRAVKARPKRWFAEGLTAGESEFLIIVGGSTDHMRVWLDVSHHEWGVVVGRVAPEAP